MRKRNARTQLSPWEPGPRTVRLIDWAVAGAPESEPLPEGAPEILAAGRRADLFGAWEGVRAFGAPAAEMLRRDYGLCEELTHRPEGLATAVQAPRLADCVSEMLLNEHKWAEREWPTREDLRGYLYRRAQNILWIRMRQEDRENSAILRAVMEAGGPPKNAYDRMERLRNIEKSLDPVRRMMPELDRHFRILAKAADARTGEVNRSLVARAYRIPEERVDSFLRMNERKWSPELERLRLELSLYVRRRPVRFDAESGGFEILRETF